MTDKTDYQISGKSQETVKKLPLTQNDDIINKTK